MAKNKNSKLIKLIQRYKTAILIWLFVSLFFIICALLIYYFLEPAENSFENVVASFLMTIGQSIIGAGLIGGGIGGVINFIFEEIKAEEEEAKERLKVFQERKEKRNIFRQKMQGILQSIHDDVELARVLVKSHKSAKTYGEQIRSRIMPSLISLKDVKRRLYYIEDNELEENLPILRVSLS